MPDIRDVLKGLSDEDRALYQETRTNMRRAYLAAHARVLPIDKYDENDDHFLDIIDLRIAILFDRAGVFDHSQGHIDQAKVNEIEKSVEGQFANNMNKIDKLTNGASAASQGWGQAK